jgi:TRAP-type C4-dicarboxylate transport system permease small subunit
MTVQNARSAIKAATQTQDRLVSCVFTFCTLLLLASVIRMWSNWFEISAVIGFDRAASVLPLITGAALVVSWWINTGND